MNPTFSLLAARRFLPLFITQFLGAFNDNLFKNALVILVTYKIAAASGEDPQILVTLAAGLFMLPFFLFSATAGQLADKFDKAKLARLIKIFEIVLMGIAALGFLTAHVNLLLIVLFGMGMHSTFFGPIKYALLPQHLSESELIPGNALIEAGTFLAILTGTLAGGLLILTQGGATIVSLAALATAAVGYFASRSIPAAPPPSPQLPISANLARETWRMIGYCRARRDVFLAILGISWFWLIGATFLSQFATYAKELLHADQGVVTLFLTVFSIGIGLGSLFCNRLLKGKIHTTYVPFAALGITVFMLDLYFTTLDFVPMSAAITGMEAFLETPGALRILLDMVMVAVCGGLYIVPLYAIMQAKSDESHRARVIAGNNILNAAFMVIAALATMGMLKFHFTVAEVFLVIAIVNAMVAFFICKLRGTTP